MLVAGCMSSGTVERQADLKRAAEDNTKLGMHYMQLGQLQTAKDKLETAEKQDPQSFRVQWALATLAERLEKPADAERYYKTAVRLEPENSEVANTYAVFLCKSAKTEQAVPLFESVIRNRLYPTPWVAATNAGVCLRSDKRLADASKYLELALTLRNDHTEAVIQLADVQLSLDKPAVARKTVDSYLALPSRPSEQALVPDVLLMGVRAALAQGDRPAADNFARKLRRDFPRSPQTQALPQLLN